MIKKIPKKALCVRDVSSWAKVSANFKFDSKGFDKSDILTSISELSPKMNALINKINELDEKDLKNNGKLYKHIIYSDVSGMYGAKMVASVLIANGKHLAYTHNLKLKEKGDLKKSINNNFALLSTSVVYKKPLPAKLKKGILATMNERPDNIFGENIRFLVLDQGFKEGIDVFDVKYIHLLEPLLTKAEQTQVIGRGTRFCGQAGLPFDPIYGWRLEVYKYNMNYNDIDVHQLFLNHANIDISSINFVAELEDILKVSAVDYSLTENIHNYNSTDNRFKNLIDKIENIKRPDLKKDKMVVNVYGKIFTNEDKIDCRENCKGVLQKAPIAILLIGALFADKKLWGAFTEKYPRPILCNQIDKNPEYCKAINQLWLSPIRFLKIYGKDLSNDLEKLRKKQKITRHNYEEILEFFNIYYISDKKALMGQMPPHLRLNYLDMKKYIKINYKNYIWPKISVENLCEKQEKEIKDESIIVKFTLTQDFVRNYFTPQSPYKGLLLYHSVGTGKTCTAIATATSTFERLGYTIIWVTRHTLKEDIWKNMFYKICNTIIQEKIKDDNLIIPKRRSDRMKLLGAKWIQPVSYKQFTNMIRGKNKFYHQLVHRNGKADPFKKTLIIIDEIHKIYSSSLSALEKPKPEVLNNMIQNSFNESGVNSVRLLLMTATPITEDPLSAIKIINLMLPKEEQFNENYGEFIKEYCNNNGIFTDDGAYRFINKVSGYISYLDRSSDLRQFAYPIMNNIMVNINKSKKSENILKIDNIDVELKNLVDNPVQKIKTKDKQLKDDNKKEIEDYKKKIKELKADKKAMANSIKDDISVKAMIDKCLESKKIKIVKGDMIVANVEKSKGTIKAESEELLVPSPIAAIKKPKKLVLKKL